MDSMSGRNGDDIATTESIAADEYRMHDASLVSSLSYRGTAEADAREAGLEA